ncbi:protein OSCP1 isoform X2 [Suricata suricatta]|uniref:Organic solute carrier partner 1 n=1 Tax=Suricata suricatta TaxID=37032 RepID=A0A673V2Q5_SURSU|nr:protein OSCP1 isoform X2 [Suricata suricatta]
MSVRLPRLPTSRTLIGFLSQPPRCPGNQAGGRGGQAARPSATQPQVSSLASLISGTMSVRTLPLLFLNLGGEMLYILDQRLRAQNIPGNKARKDEWTEVDRKRVLNDIISTMFNQKFMEELFKPQELYSKKALRTVYDRLAHASIMRLNQASMDKLYDLMTMAFKHQVLLCPRPKDVLLVTFNHLDAIKGFIQDSPTILHQVEETFRQLTETYGGLSAGEFQMIRQTLLTFFQDLHIRVSIFLKDKVQNSNGRFVLPVSGPVPWGTEVPGLIRMFNNKGKEVKKVQFKHGGNYVMAPKEGSFELYGDRVLKLGTNMYSMNRTVETHMSRASKNSTSPSQESIAPNPLAKEELNFLARLMGGMEIKKPSGPEPGFRLNLFTTDEEEEQAALTRPEELSYEVINIQATQDQQRNEELARIMGELEVTDQPRQSASKGEDLLAMMDEL